MLGAIAGDTIGSVYEFANTKDYNFTLITDRSNYTDDTVMTAAVAKWLLKDKERSYQGLESSMLEFARKYPCPMGGYGGGFYTWLFYPEKLYSYDYNNGQPPYCSRTKRHPYGSWGNGSAMRASAVGWFFDTLEETERVAEISAAITHNHPEGIKGAQATAAAIWLARNGKSKEEIREYISQRFVYNLDKTYHFLHPFYDWDSSCQGTVPQAIICFLDSVGFEDAIRMAVSLGGDSDTLACITGGIAEAYYGGVPNGIAREILNLLPNDFLRLISSMQKTTDYGSVCPIDDKRLNIESASLIGSDPQSIEENPIPLEREMAIKDSWAILPMPEDSVTVHLDLLLSDEQMSSILYGHIPNTMEDHWFMYCADNKIHYHRSYSGICIFEAAFEESFNGFQISNLTINRDPDQYRGPIERATALFCALLMGECGGDASIYWKQYRQSF